jgi:hypothetical protein
MLSRRPTRSQRSYRGATVLWQTSGLGGDDLCAQHRRGRNRIRSRDRIRSRNRIRSRDRFRCRFTHRGRNRRVPVQKPGFPAAA